MKPYFIPVGLLVLATKTLSQVTTCNRDNCFRQVAATSARPFPSSASADCGRLLLTTVIPCPVTVTVGAEPTVSTVTQFSSPTVTFTATTITPDIVTSFETQTVTATTTVTQAPAKRRHYPFAAARIEGEIKYVKRVAASCTPQTIRPTSIPAYASSCRSPAQYSSACSCNGITGSVTTVSPTTSTVTTTPTITATITTFVTQSFAVTETAPTPSTTVTVITTATTTTIIVAPQNTCPSYGTILIGCSQDRNCDTTGVCSVVASEDDCFYKCINDNSCVAYAYSGNNRNCNIFKSCC